jgi:hypothetical protein
VRSIRTSPTMRTTTFTDVIIPESVGTDGSYTVNRLLTFWKDGQIVGWKLVQRYVRF